MSFRKGNDLHWYHKMKLFVSKEYSDLFLCRKLLLVQQRSERIKLSENITSKAISCPSVQSLRGLVLLLPAFSLFGFAVVGLESEAFHSQALHEDALQTFSANVRVTEIL